MTDTVRVALVDDEALMRSGIRLVLEGDPRIRVVAEAADGRAGVDAVTRAQPDMVLMDIRMPVMDGIDAVRALTSAPATAGIPVVMLSAFDTDTYILDALRAGAVGFLLKSTPPAALIAAVHAAVEGQQLLSSDVLASLVALADAPVRVAGASRSDRLAQLSEREVEVYRVVHMDGRWYAVGHCLLRGALRSFRIDRIEGCALLDTGFVPPPNFDALAFLQREAPPKPQTYDVSVWVDAPPEQLCGGVSVWHSEIQPDGTGTRLRGQREDLTCFAAFLLGLDFDFRVDSPAELRAVFVRLGERCERVSREPL